MKNIIINTGLILLLIANYAFAQEKLITQELEPHPYLDINEWFAHKGDLTLEEVMKDNPSLWKSETLNVPNWEKNGIKWFKNDIVIPEEFDGLEVILHINVAPSAIVYVNGKELFRCSSDYTGRGVLALSAKVGDRYSIQVKTINGGYNNRFYYARITGMPEGYGEFLSSFSIPIPNGGIPVKDWKFKMNVEDEASQVEFDDALWEDSEAAHENDEFS